MSSNVIVEDDGKLVLLEEVREHYGLTPQTPTGIIQTRGGILLVPFNNEPMSESLARELDHWQSLGDANLELYPYENIEA